MKTQLCLHREQDDAGDIADARTLAEAMRRAWNWIEQPNPIKHFCNEGEGNMITAEQLDRAEYVFTAARRKYQQYADRHDNPSHFCPIDEAKAIVAAIDDALEVVERWKGVLGIRSRSATPDPASGSITPETASAAADAPTRWIQNGPDDKRDFVRE